MANARERVGVLKWGAEVGECESGERSGLQVIFHLNSYPVGRNSVRGWEG